MIRMNGINTKNIREKTKETKAITIVALVITIIVLLIISGVTVGLLFNNGILDKSKKSVQENEKQTATELLNLKITKAQIENYAKKQEMPTLQDLADSLCEDEEMQYVSLASKKTASLDKIKVGENTSIFTKLTQYPYEFEINGSLQLASVDGIQMADNTTSTKIKQLEENVLALQTKMQALEEKSNNLTSKNYTNLTIPKGTSGAYGNLNIDAITIEKDCKLLVTSWFIVNTNISNQVAGRIYSWRNGQTVDEIWTGGNYPNSGALSATRVFECKAGDQIKFHTWNWSTSSTVTVSRASIIMQEI